MIRQIEGRPSPMFLLAAVMTLVLAGDVRGDGWELARERGVGGVTAPKPVVQTDVKGRPADKVGFRIIVIPDEQPGPGPAKAVPATPFEGKQAPPKGSNPKAGSKANTLLAVAPEDVAPSDALPVTRTAPRAKLDVLEPSAVTALSGSAGALASRSPPKPIKIEVIDALPSAEPAPRLATRSRLPVYADQQASGVIEQVQLLPNAGAALGDILAPRANEVTPEGARVPTITPTPREPLASKLQPVLLAPNLGASPGQSVLRTAPPPDNALIELVEAPSDYSLSVAAGTSQVLNISRPVYNVIISDPNVADATELSTTQIVVHGIGLGRTNMYGVGDNDEVIFAVNIDTVPNVDVAQAKLTAAAPSSATRVSLDSDVLVAEGVVNGVGDAIKIANVADELRQTLGPTVNNTTIAGSQQVNLRVRFAEVSRTDVFNLGVNWDVLADTGDFLFGLSTGNFLAGGGDGLARDLISGEEFGRLDFAGEFGDVSVDAFIDALQREGIVNILAEPNLTSVNGEPASFLAGGEVPILVPGGGGNGNVTIDYKAFGVSLDFIPTLLPGERINLRVRPEVSSISNSGGVVLDGFAVPAFTVRRAETSVELASGQTFAIAGLFQRDLTTDTDKFPILGDVPVLGQLFRSERFRRFETELIILITPYLVQPISNRNIVLPNDRLDDPANPVARTAKRRAGFIVN